MLAAKRGDSEVARLLGVPEKERKTLGVAAARGTQSANDPSPPRSSRLSRSWKSRAIISSASAAAIPAMLRICPRPPRPSPANRGLPAPKEIPQLPQSMHTLNPERIMDLAVRRRGQHGLGDVRFRKQRRSQR